MSGQEGGIELFEEGYLSEGHFSKGYLSEGHLSKGYLSKGYLSEGHLSMFHLSMDICLREIWPRNYFFLMHFCLGGGGTFLLRLKSICRPCLVLILLPFL